MYVCFIDRSSEVGSVTLHEKSVDEMRDATMAKLGKTLYNYIIIMYMALIAIHSNCCISRT
jgi:hypothetical protein